MMAQIKEKVVNAILESLNQSWMDSKQLVKLLKHIGQIIEIGMKMIWEGHIKQDRQSWACLAKWNTQQEG